jgi:hypothetical protein
MVNHTYNDTHNRILEVLYNTDVSVVFEFDDDGTSDGDGDGEPCIEQFDLDIAGKEEWLNVIEEYNTRENYTRIVLCDEDDSYFKCQFNE